jgi:hypothetical protein
VFILKKIFFLRTSRPISIKLGTNHPYVKRIHNYTNQGPGPFEFKGEIITKTGWCHLKIFFSRTTEPEELIFT